MDSKTVEALAIDQTFFRKAQQHSGISVRISGSTYSVKLPYYEEMDDDRLHKIHYLPESTIGKLRASANAVGHDHLWQNSGLRAVLQRHAVALDNFLKADSELWRRTPRLIRGENCHAFYRMPSGRGGMLDVGYFLADIAHVLGTSTDPLIEERKFWQPCLAEMVTLKPRRMQRAMDGLALLFSTISGAIFPGSNTRTEKTSPSAATKLSSYHPEDVERAITDAFIQLMDSDDLSELELRALARGENPPKVLDAALVNLARAALVIKSRTLKPQLV